MGYGQFTVAPVIKAVRSDRPVPKAGIRYKITKYEDACDEAELQTMVSGKAWGVFQGRMAVVIFGDWDGDMPEPLKED